MAAGHWIAGGALSGALAVGLGAFGAHALKARLPETSLAIFETGVRYQMYHALALILTGLLIDRTGDGGLRVAAWAFALGSLLFSGSLYILVATGQRWLGMITPVGGLGFLVGWVALAVAAFRL